MALAAMDSVFSGAFVVPRPLPAEILPAPGLPTRTDTAGGVDQDHPPETLSNVKSFLIYSLLLPLNRR